MQNLYLEHIDPVDETERLMPLCLNCRTWIDDRNGRERASLPTFEKKLLFRTYADQLHVKESQISSWWDLIEEELPFCQPCLNAVKSLQYWVHELESIQLKIRKIIDEMKIKIILSSQNLNPRSQHCYSSRDLIFRNLAVADFYPSLNLQKIDDVIEDGKDFSCNLSPKLNLFVDNYIKCQMPFDDTFEIMSQELEDDLLAGMSTPGVNCEGGRSNTSYGETQITQVFVHEKESEETYSMNWDDTCQSPRSDSASDLAARSPRDESSTSASLRPRKLRSHKPSHMIELLKLKNGQYKCGTCGVFLKKDNFRSHVKQKHSERPSCIENSRAERRRKVSILKAMRKRATNEKKQSYTNRSRTKVRGLTSSKKSYQKKFKTQKQRSVDGNELIGGIEMIRLENERLKCGACSNVLKNKKCFIKHVHFIHLGYRRPGMEGKPERRKAPVRIVEDEDGKLSIGGIPLLKDGESWICGLCDHKLKYRHNMGYHIRSHLGIEPPKPNRRRKLNFPLFYGPPTFEEWVSSRQSSCIKDGRRYYENVEIIRADSENGYICGQCSKFYRQVSNMMNHIKAKHMPDGKCVSCNVCNRKYGRLSDLRAHEKIHSEERTFICHECGVSFKTRSVMLGHMKRIHEKQQNHKCDICGKAFFSRNDCSKHRRTHGKTNFPGL